MTSSNVLFNIVFNLKIVDIEWYSIAVDKLYIQRTEPLIN